MRNHDQANAAGSGCRPGPSAEDGRRRAPPPRIAKAAGVANGTLFHHFPSKAAIQSLYQDIKLRRPAATPRPSAALPFQEQARHYWHAQAMGWITGPPVSSRFVLGLSHSPCWPGPRAARSQLRPCIFCRALSRGARPAAN